MARGDQGNFTGVNRYYTKARKVTAPISLEDLMEKEVQSSLEDRAMRELSVLAYPENEDSTKIKQKICILDHPKKPDRGSSRKACCEESKFLHTHRVT